MSYKKNVNENSTLTADNTNDDNKKKKENRKLNEKHDIAPTLEKLIDHPNPRQEEAGSTKKKKKRVRKRKKNNVHIKFDDADIQEVGVVKMEIDETKNAKRSKLD